MANDREVLREIWEGKLPVCFQLNSDEVYELRQPDPFYLMVPRLSYFPLVTDKVRKHFSRYVASEKQEQEMWLDCNGVPIKWHFPIGVLFDIHMGCEPQLPWNLTVHFDKYPDDSIFRCPNKETVEAYFMSCIKEADVLKHRSQIVSSMQKKDHNQLWQGLQNGIYIYKSVIWQCVLSFTTPDFSDVNASTHCHMTDFTMRQVERKISKLYFIPDKFDQFWAVNRKLMETSGEQNNFKYIPFRCYLEDRYIQKLIKPVNDEGQRKTLADLLKEVFPGKEKIRVRTHGIEPPSDTTLQWMSEHLSYPDNFLHLYVQI